MSSPSAAAAESTVAVTRMLGGGVRATATVLAAALAVAALVHHGVGVRGLVAAFVAVVLVLLSVIDIEERRLPNRIVLPATAVVLAAHLAFVPDRALEWVLSSLAAALFLFVPMLVYRAGMGMGDVKLALLLGAALGTTVAFALVVGVFSAGLFAGALLLARGAEARRQPIPYGPFLAFGALVALFVGDPLGLI